MEDGKHHTKTPPPAPAPGSSSTAAAAQEASSLLKPPTAPYALLNKYSPNVLRKWLCERAGTKPVLAGFFHDTLMKEALLAKYNDLRRRVEEGNQLAISVCDHFVHGLVEVVCLYPEKLSAFTKLVVVTMPGSGHSPPDEEPLTHFLASKVVNLLKGRRELKGLEVVFDPIIRKGKLETQMKEFADRRGMSAGNLVDGFHQLKFGCAAEPTYDSETAFLTLDDDVRSGQTLVGQGDVFLKRETDARKGRREEGGKEGGEGGIHI